MTTPATTPSSSSSFSSSSPRPTCATTPLRRSWPVLVLAGIGAVGCAGPSASGQAAVEGAVATADAAAAGAAVPAEPFVLTATSGEASRSASRTVSTWTVTGARLHLAVRYEGPDAGSPGREPQDADGDINDPDAVLAQALAAEAQLPLSTPEPALVDVTYRSFCIERAGARRCVWQVGDAPASDAFRALQSLESRLTAYIALVP
jgi:hypothetical protein